MGVKNSQMFIQTKTSPRLEITARWGYLPISVVLWSERRGRCDYKDSISKGGISTCMSIEKCRYLFRKGRRGGGSDKKGL